MNREIKLRAWLPDEKGWLADGFSISMDGKYWYDDNCHEWRIAGNLILMQYTGLKDKNGKEIYEGDIVRLIPTNPVIFVVEVVLAKWGYKTVFKDRDNGKIAQDYFTNNLEIIGNICEHPELLK